MKPLEPLLPGEMRSEYIRRVDSPMGRARALVEAHIADYGMVPHPDKIKEAIAAELGLAQWRPIATAPRDGTRILVWHPAVKGMASDRQAGADIDRWKDGRWWHSYPAQQPSHWMPVPAPPLLVVGAIQPDVYVASRRQAEKQEQSIEPFKPHQNCDCLMCIAERG